MADIVSADISADILTDISADITIGRTLQLATAVIPFRSAFPMHRLRFFPRAVHPVLPDAAGPGALHGHADVVEGPFPIVEVAQCHFVLMWYSLAEHPLDLVQYDPIGTAQLGRYQNSGEINGTLDISCPIHLGQQATKY